MDDKPELMKGAAPGTSVIDWDARDFPWWLVGMLLIIGVMGVAVVLNANTTTPSGPSSPAWG